MKKVLPLISASTCCHQRLSFLCTFARLRACNEDGSKLHRRFRFGENIPVAASPVTPSSAARIRFVSQNSPIQLAEDLNRESNGSRRESCNKKDDANVKASEPASKAPVAKKGGSSSDFNQDLSKDDYQRFLLYKNALMEIAKARDRGNHKLRMIVEAMVGMNCKMNIKECNDVLYYLSVLNIPHEGLLLKLTNMISKSLDTVYKPRPLISNISRSVAQLLVRDENLLDELVKWCKNRKDSVDLVTSVNVIQALAVLNYLPADGEEWIQEIAKVDRMDFPDTITYLNLIWSLTLLDRIDSQLLASALDINLRKTVEAAAFSRSMRGFCNKFANVSAYASLRDVSRSGDRDNFAVFNQDVNETKIRRGNDATVKSLVDALTHVMPRRTYITFEVSESGSVIDAICYFDSEGNPAKYSPKADKDAVRVAIAVLRFNELCFPDKKVAAGLAAFHKRFLEAKGYRVLFVPYNEFPTDSNLKCKMRYVASRIKALVENAKIEKAF